MVEFIDGFGKPKWRPLRPDELRILKLQTHCRGNDHIVRIDEIFHLLTHFFYRARIQPYGHMRVKVNQASAPFPN